ncbi:MAG: DNA mismatch repair protein MutS [Nitrospirota bacterium]
MAEPTPLMRQYDALKANHPGTLLLFRVGDFYELFGDDAVVAAPILQIALTSRDKNKDTGIPLCGVPYHAASGYIAKLLAAGKRVALAEQMEEPKPGALVARDVVRVLTPGTVVDDTLLCGSEHAYLAAVLRDGDEAAIARVDVSTGDFDVASSRGPQAAALSADELARTDPREVLVGPGWADPPRPGAVYQACPPEAFDSAEADRALREQFPDAEAWTALSPIERRAAGALIRYVRHTLKGRCAALSPPTRSAAGDTLDVDESAQRTLELVRGGDGSRQHSLLAVLDETVTAMGGRLLRDRLLHPLCAIPAIEARLDDVAAFVADPETRAVLREHLGTIGDVERAVSRAAVGSSTPRDLAMLGRSLEAGAGIAKLLTASSEPRVRAMGEHWPDFGRLIDRLSAALVPSPPPTARDGGVIREGYHQELDALRVLRRDASAWLAQLEARERARTGIDSLKVRHNHVFGYYLEVTKANAGRVPPEYRRRQTLVNAERYVIPELLDLESKITGADEKSRALEIRLIEELREAVVAHAAGIQAYARRLATIDVAAGLAHAASCNRWVRPTMVAEPVLRLRESRHPVVERGLPAQHFVPNDTDMDGGSTRLALLTGPNMAGKSTYMRQVALIVIMAQMGSYVPAEEAVIGLVDRLFARVGAQDDIAGGRSTFMVEMSETAAILARATPRSLILLDEIGRGTSTFDGISIAWAVAEDVHTRIGARTLFATHYHELTALADSLPGLKNYKAAVREWNEEIVFMRKIVAGGADRSYGIQVARLAGLPDTVIRRAREILRDLEQRGSHSQASPRPDAQPDLFAAPVHPIVAEISGLDVSRLTPIDALNILDRLKKRIDGTDGRQALD